MGAAIIGMGDEIMVSGQARVAQQKNNLPVVVFDRNLRIRAHEMWANNRRIHITWDRKSAITPIHNGPGVRPYIANKTDERWTWKDFTPPVGELYFSKDELRFASLFPKDVIIIEPNTKHKAPVNKDWGLARWMRTAELLHKEGLRVVQMGIAGAHELKGVEFIITPWFRHACAILAGARAAVLPEGGLHHAAAALNVPAVVVYGGFISPRQTGYELHRNIFTGGEPCGMRVPCGHCKKAMSEISPEMVVHNLMEVINERKDIPRL